QSLISKLAERIAVNRTVAGVHFPIDTWAGAVLGRTVGQLVLAHCGAPVEIGAHSYKAHNTDFSLHAFMDKGQGPGSAHAAGVNSHGSFSIGASDKFKWLWGKAEAEFKLAG